MLFQTGAENQETLASTETSSNSTESEDPQYAKYRRLLQLVSSDWLIIIVVLL